tara:strand:+ start:22260 stop:22625 length:366 start_codon:yes stop_codon:yes gene_type:complete
MAILIGKYEFDSKTQAESKINALPSVKDEEGNDVPSHKHTIVKLGNIVLEQGEYDSEGEETKAPVLSSKYHVDCAWRDIEETDEEGNVTIDHPYGWKTYAIELEDEGVHGFMGIEYQTNKI